MKTTLALGSVDLQKKPGFLLVDKIVSKCDIFKNSYLNDNSHRSNWIPSGAILKATCLMQSQAMTDFQDIDELNNDTIFRELVGYPISQETLRQRLNAIAKEDSVISDVDNSLVNTLKGATFNTVKINGKNYIPLDIDVTPFCNPNVKKEEISRTYKDVYGFAPIMAYLGHFILALELRPGSQHSENGAIEFLLRCLNLIKKLDLNPEDILVRVDSAHDDGDFVKVLEENHFNYIVKKNFRRESRAKYAKFALQNVKPQVSDDESVRIYYYVNSNKKPTSAPDIKGYAVYQVTEPYKDERGILLYPLFLDMNTNRPLPNSGISDLCEVEAMWTNLPMTKKDCANFGFAFGAECFALYRDHATSEQFHSELKTDMDMELLPSKYFATNKLFLALSAIAFNALRLIGDKALSLDASLHHRKTRRLGRMRLRTVIDKLCTIACKVVRHAREMVVIFGRRCRYYDTFVKLYR